MFGIDCGHVGVALNDAFAGGHHGGLVVGLVALAVLELRPGSACAGAVVGVGRQPGANAAGFDLKLLDALGFFGAKGGLWLCGAVITVSLAMTLEQGLHGGVHLVGLVDEVGSGAAALFACVGGQLDAVDSEHLATDQALRVAHEQDLFEDLTDQVPKPLMKAAMRVVVKWGQLSPLKAMKMTWRCCKRGTGVRCHGWRSRRANKQAARP